MKTKIKQLIITNKLPLLAGVVSAVYVLIQMFACKALAIMEDYTISSIVCVAIAVVAMPIGIIASKK